MPIEDRVVLFYGACAEAWHRERNPEAAARYDMKFQQKLAMMSSKMESTIDMPKLHSSKVYLDEKRKKKAKFFPFAEGVTNADEDINVITWTLVSLNDNQSTPQTIFALNKKALFVRYAILRGTNNAETGEIFLAMPTDQSSVGYSPSSVEVGDSGITLIGSNSGVNLQLQYTSTSTGSPASFYYYVIGPE